MIVEQDRGQRAAHVPDDVITEHAKEDVGAHAASEAMVDRAHFQFDGLDGTEGAFDLGQALVGRTVAAVSRLSAGTLVRNT